MESDGIDVGDWDGDGDGDTVGIDVGNNVGKSDGEDDNELVGGAETSKDGCCNGVVLCICILIFDSFKEGENVHPFKSISWT